MLSSICAWTHDWTNQREAGDLWRHCAHYDVTVMADYGIVDIFRLQFIWLLIGSSNKLSSILKKTIKFFARFPLTWMFTDGDFLTKLGCSVHALNRAHGQRFLCFIMYFTFRFTSSIPDNVTLILTFGIRARVALSCVGGRNAGGYGCNSRVLFRPLYIV